MLGARPKEFCGWGGSITNKGEELICLFRSRDLLHSALCKKACVNAGESCWFGDDFSLTPTSGKHFPVPIPSLLGGEKKEFQNR